MPGSHVRLSAGRAQMTDELQALCYFAGANSVFSGAQLLTTPNADTDRDRALFDRLGLGVEPLVPARETPGACGHGHAAVRAA
jgi:biotin synthase